MKTVDTEIIQYKLLGVRTFQKVWSHLFLKHAQGEQITVRYFNRKSNRPVKASGRWLGINFDINNTLPQSLCFSSLVAGFFVQMETK